MPIRVKPSSRVIAGVLLAGWCGLSFAAPAERKAELKEKQGELRERLHTLRRDLAKSEKSHADAADNLRRTESAISDANRNLRQLTDKRNAVQSDIRGLEDQSRHLAEETATQQRHLSRLLYRHYVAGGPMGIDAFSMLMAGRDPNQASIDNHYLTLLSRSKADLIADLHEKAQEKKRLADLARDKNAELAGIEQKQQAARAKLVDQQKQRQELLAQSSKHIKAQRREIGALQKDEKRLSQLLSNLAKASKRSPAARSSRNNVPPAAQRNERTPDPVSATGAFAALRGKLSLPVRGEITGRFGSPRPEGGTTWKGLFIRSAEGADVKAVAGGEVVFADWLRGFGNLLVIDHGDAFLSVYGNNQSLLKEAGQRVAAGDSVATVGNTGGNPESGLYFELRHQGQAFDPIRWVRLR